MTTVRTGGHRRARGRPDDGRDLGMLPGAPRRPGELLTRGDVCHVHADRAAAERCGVLLGGARAGPAR